RRDRRGLRRAQGDDHGADHRQRREIRRRTLQDARKSAALCLDAGHRQQRRVHRGNAGGAAGMTAARRIVIVGGGPAGVGAALAARAQDAAAEIVLISDEDCEPYEKPPLSKAVLIGKAKPQDAPVAGPGGVAAHKIAFQRGARVRAIDRTARAVVTEAGERISYDALVLASGSINRVLPMFPPGPGLYYLRTAEEALALKAH